VIKMAKSKRKMRDNPEASVVEEVEKVEKVEKVEENFIDPNASLDTQA